MTILWPIFALSFLFSLLVVGLNDIAVSWGREGVKRVVLDSVEQIAYSMLRTSQTYSGNGFSISVTRVDGHRLIGPTITIHDGDETLTIVAEEAELTSMPELNVLAAVLDLDVEELTTKLSLMLGVEPQNLASTLDYYGAELIQLALEDPRQFRATLDAGPGQMRPARQPVQTRASQRLKTVLQEAT